MDAFRNLLKGWVGKLLLTIFILPFAFFGIEGLFQSAGRGDAEVVVNGTEITKPEIDRIAKAQRDNLLRRMGANADPSMISLEMVRPSAVEFLIRKELLSQAAEIEGLYVAQENAKSYVRAMPQFQDETGEFSQRRLEQLLAQVGYTGTYFFNEVREELLAKQLETAISGSAFVTPAEVKNLVVLDRQQRDVATLEIKAADFRDKVEVGDEDIQVYYQANQTRFQTPEKVKAEYLHVTLANFPVSDEDVTEDELQAAFEKELLAAADKERRRAQHILVEINDDVSEEQALEKIKQAKAALDGGSSFDEVAMEYSDDIATAKLGGDLGFAGKGVYDEQFEQTLFSLEEGATSDVVKSDFGFHIIRLSEINREEMPDFENEKERLLSELKKLKSQEALAIASEDLNQKAFEHPDTLIDAAELVSNAEIMSSDWITRAGGKGVLSDAKVTAKLFEPEFIEERVNSEVIELANGEMVIVRVTDYEPSSFKPLEDVKDQVKNAVIAEKAKEKAAEVANGLLAKLNTGTSSEEVATEAGKEWKINEAIKRQASELNRQVVEKAFEMGAPSEGASFDKVSLPSGDQVIVSVTKVEEGVYDLSETEEQQMTNMVQTRFGQYDFNDYLETLKENAEIQKRQI